MKIEDLPDPQFVDRAMSLMRILDAAGAFVAITPSPSGVGRTALHRGAFRLRDISKNRSANTLDGSPQSATCVYCMKTVATWKGRARGARYKMGFSWSPKQLEAAVRDHVPRCAEEWLWGILARWSLGTATDEERQAITEWRKNYMREPHSGEPDQPPWYSLAPHSMKGIWDKLPTPIGTDKTIAIEMMCLTIAKIGEPRTSWKDDVQKSKKREVAEDHCADGVAAEIER